MSKQTYIILLIVLILTFSVTGCKKEKKLNDYNVVLIVIDTLRSDHLPFYGYKKNTAPFMWELSKKSILFENAFSASSWTSPATASIFTSLYPFQHGVNMGLLAIRNAQRINPKIKINRIPQEITTITEVMKANGYQTYGVADNLNIDYRQGFAQGFDKLRTFNDKQAPTVNRTIKKWRKKLMANGKYYLYIHYMDPHAPYYGREPWYKPFDEDRKNRISAYDSEINFTDQHIKELFELFKWDKNTVIIITSDHGEGLWDHGMMGHGKTLYREEIQVPLMIYMPGDKSVRKVSTNVSTIDILPTVRDIIGLDKSEIDEGVSLVPLMKGLPNDLNNRNLFSYLWVQIKDTKEWKATIYKKWHFLMKMPNFRHIFSLLFDKKESDNKYDRAKKTSDILE
ncbi:MAG: sulfatase, partial [bacterium]|nr:sulfatase [bacterium]